MVNTIPVVDLKSPTDPNIPFYSFKQPIALAVITHDILNEFGMMCKAVIITNNDGANAISVVNGDPNNPPETIPPSSKGEDDSWTPFVRVTPNAGTGNGLLELQLVKLEDAKKSPKMSVQAYDRMAML